MDAVLYEKLLEELRSDLAQTTPMLEELESVETFLQRRMGSVADKSSYQNVLDDISSDINGHNQSIEELKRIDRFVSSQLNKPAFDLNTSPRPTKPKTQVPVEPKTVAEAPRVNKPAGQPVAKPPVADSPKLNPDSFAGTSSGMTIEFGPDGFPIGAGAKPSSDQGEAADVSTGGATINFGPDGFPVDFPKSDS
ncbi:MAG: hypothetical protein KDA84_12745 [Planctomycetaceae bacterium]|nr:hypothetical protein [Planctomycetaceae bacterium]